MKKQLLMKRPILLFVSLVSLLWCCGNSLVYARELQAPSNETTITGVVLDVEGNALIGVNVGVIGTPKGTTTDLDGFFSLEVSKGDKLTFAYLGYQTYEHLVTDQTRINIIMREASLVLEDVVVVGYGTQKKVSVTASMSAIEPRALVSVATPSLSNTLGGHLPGIITRQTSGEPGFDQAQVFIRGLATWGDAAPLVVVDGVIRDLNLVNAYEIESFSILKDASATAVYGVQGANGVILINTRKGYKGKPRITFRTESAQQTGLRFPDYIQGYEFASLMNEASANSGKPLPWTEEDIELFRNGSDPYLHPNVNWTNEVYKKTSDQTINNLSVTGGDETTRYFINVGYTSQGGLYQEDPANPYNTNSRLNRYTLRSNIDINLSKEIVLDLGLGAIIETRNYQGTPALDIATATKRISPINYPVRNPDGTPGGGPGYMMDNPWALTTQSGYTSLFYSTIQGTFGLKWDLSNRVTKGLSLSGKFAFDQMYWNEVFRRKTYEVKQYLGQDADGEDQYTVQREGTSLGYSHGRQGNRALYWEVATNYDRTFGGHSLNGVFLFNRSDFINLESATSTLGLPYRRQGIAARIAYNYGSRYLAEFNMGYNGSENFPKGKRYGFFPSLSIGWIMSNEKFWNDNHIVNHLKIRASHGQAGNDRLVIRRNGVDEDVRFLYVTRMNKNANGYLFGSSQQYLGGMEEGLLGVQDVTWEVSTKTNAGFDVQFFNNMISLQVDAFYEHRNNILKLRSSIPGYVGFLGSSTPPGNIGEVKNRGFDGMLEFKKTTGNGFYYSFRGNITFARNEIIENDQAEPAYPYLWEKGNPIGQPFGLVALGFFQDEEEIANSPTQTFQEQVIPGDIKYEDRNNDGVIDSYDRVPIGFPAVPEIMFGFGGTVAYKGFDLSLHFSGVANRSLFLDLEGMWPFMLEYPNYNVFREYYDNRWIPGADNSNAKYPVVIQGNNPNNYQTSTLYMRDASYIKLRNAELGYTIPKRICNNLRLSGIRLFTNGTNLFCWDKIKIVDPEFNITGGYPQQRNINFGVQIDF